MSTIKPGMTVKIIRRVEGAIPLNLWNVVMVVTDRDECEIDLVQLEHKITSQTFITMLKNVEIVE